jgi:hypothetical protein
MAKKDITQFEGIVMATPLLIQLLAETYGIKIQLICDGSKKKTQLSFYKNFGSNGGTRSKKVDVADISLLTMNEISLHANQFLNPYLGF